MNHQQPSTRIPLSEVEQELQASGAKYKAEASEKNGLDLLIATHEKIKLTKKSKINFSPPILTYDKQPFIFPSTIVLLQGQTGVHKSRLAEHIASMLLAPAEGAPNILGFSADRSKDYTLCYIDTERNINEQLPAAIQRIQEVAGFDRSIDPEDFLYTSLIEVKRDERLQSLESYLNNIRKDYERHIVVILDIISDCIRDFNHAEQSMEMIDYLNRMINHFDTTFICVLHENPGQQKARGHLGTELMNKASTIIQISLECEERGIFKIRLLKIRSAKKGDTIFIKYCEERQILVLANPDEIRQVEKERVKKAPEDAILEALENVFENAAMVTKTELMKTLRSQFDTSEKTLMERLQAIVESASVLYPNRIPHVLIKTQIGRDVAFRVKNLAQNETELPL